MDTIVIGVKAQFKMGLPRAYQGSAMLPAELMRRFPGDSPDGRTFFLGSESALVRCLRRAAAFAQALPNQAMLSFETQFQAALAALDPPAAKNTEVQRLVRQRVGQQAFRQAMLDHWGSACALTGMGLPQALRASPMVGRFTDLRALHPMVAIRHRTQWSIVTAARTVTTQTSSQTSSQTPENAEARTERAS